jgi:hypothetical protein
MSYDSEEAKKEALTNAESLERVREIFNEEMIEKINDYIESITPLILETNLKAKSGIKLSEEEIQLLREHAPKIKMLCDALLYSKNLVEEKLVVQSDTFFFHIHKLAEAGDEKAKKMYEEMLPLYRQAHGLDARELNN